MGERDARSDILQGTLDLMVLQTLDAMGPLHGYGIARRIEQVSEDVLQLNQGTIYASLLRLQQRRWISASWGTSDNNRQGEVLRHHPKAGRKQLAAQAAELGAHRRRHRPAAAAGGALMHADPPGSSVACRAWPRSVTGRPLDDDFDARWRSHLDDAHRGLHPPRHDARRGAPRGASCDSEDRCRSRNSTATTAACRSSRRRCRTSATRSARCARTRPTRWSRSRTLAIGIGAGTAVFSVVGAVLLRPLPYRAPDELVRIFETNPLRRLDAEHRGAGQLRRLAGAEQESSPTSPPTSSSTANGSGAGDVFLTGFGEPQGLKSLGVSGNLFQVLGAAPLIGRTFTDDEQFEGKARVAILSYGLWQIGLRRRSGDRRQDDHAERPRLRRRRRDAARRSSFPDATSSCGCRSATRRELIARVAAAALARRRRAAAGRACRSSRRARTWTASRAQLEQQYPDTNTQMGVRLEPLHDSFADEPRTALLMLSGAVGLLFLIVCANIANLQLGRARQPRARAGDPPRARRRTARGCCGSCSPSRSCSRSLGGALGFGARGARASRR